MAQVLTWAGRRCSSTRRAQTGVSPLQLQEAVPASPEAVTSRAEGDRESTHTFTTTLNGPALPRGRLLLPYLQDVRDAHGQGGRGGGGPMASPPSVQTQKKKKRREGVRISLCRGWSVLQATGATRAVPLTAEMLRRGEGPGRWG